MKCLDGVSREAICKSEGISQHEFECIRYHLTTKNIPAIIAGLERVKHCDPAQRRLALEKEKKR